LRENPGRWVRALAAAVFIPCLAGAAADKRQAWPVPVSVQRFLPTAVSDAVPTLPAPSLLPEPEFTIDTRNTVYWFPDSARAALGLVRPGSVILFFEIQARNTATDVLLWGYLDAGSDSAVFVFSDSTWEGNPIEYRLRYYAQSAGGQNELSFWSAIQVSVQDWHPPLCRWRIEGLQRTTMGNWVIGRTLSVRVTASDPPYGKVSSLFIRETDSASDATDNRPYDPTQPVVEEAVSYTLAAEAHRPVSLRLWVTDLPGQPSPSQSESLTLFWMPSEEGEMFCFPNPFNPLMDARTVVRIAEADVQTARIFDPFGNLIRVLRKTASEAFFEWDGRNERGDLVSNGGYLCVLDGRENRYCKIAVLR
jgi:hypothetical protein